MFKTKCVCSLCQPAPVPPPPRREPPPGYVRMCQVRAEECAEALKRIRSVERIVQRLAVAIAYEGTLRDFDLGEVLAAANILKERSARLEITMKRYADKAGGRV
jgi:hypothetical protein